MSCLWSFHQGIEKLMINIGQWKGSVRAGRHSALFSLPGLNPRELIGTLLRYLGIVLSISSSALKYFKSYHLPL